MIDYRDGYWHRWYEGECPVDPEDMIEYLYGSDNNRVLRGKAKSLPWETAFWSGGPDERLESFRVVKKAATPRDFWVNEYTDDSMGQLHPTRQAAIATVVRMSVSPKRCIHLREVVEEDEVWKD